MNRIHQLLSRYPAGRAAASPGRRRRRASMVGLALIIATSFLSLTSRTVAADYDHTESLGQYTSQNDTGYFQTCESDTCDYFGVDFTWSGAWSTEEWRIDGPPYNYDLDFEGLTSYGYIDASGDIIDGKNGPPVQISPIENDWIDECYHGRSDCGSSYTDYDTADDSGRRHGAVSCAANDWCDFIEVDNFERTGYVDPGIGTGVCEHAAGANTLPEGHNCDGAEHVYDMGQ